MSIRPHRPTPSPSPTTADRTKVGIRRSRDGRRRGQSLVEFALILPVMLVLVAGALDLGRIFYANISLNNAAREGAMQAAQTPASFQEDQPCNTTTNLVVCRVQLEAKGSQVQIADSDIDMTCSTSGCPAQPGSTVTVTVAGQFQLLTPLLAAIFGNGPIPISSAATAQLEYLPDISGVTAPPTPGAGFSATPLSGDVPLTVAFTDSSTDATGWLWNFGDGGTSTQQNPTYTYTAPGTYDVSLQVVNLSGTDETTKTGYITVTSPAPSPSPSASPSPSPSPACTFIPNVIGQTPGNAAILIGNAGFWPVGYADLSTGTKNKVQSQNPDHTQCRAPGTTVDYHYRPN